MCMSVDIHIGVKYSSGSTEWITGHGSEWIFYCVLDVVSSAAPRPLLARNRVFFFRAVGCEAGG